MRRRPAGLTVLETQVGVLLLFLATLYLLSMYASGQRFAVRGREYTAATFLARNRMEQLLAAPPDVLASGSGQCDAPHEDYTWRVTVDDFEVDLKSVEVEVVSPRGARARLRTLRRTFAFFGVACDPATQRLVASRAGQPAPTVLVDGGSESAGPTLPDGSMPARAGGLAGYPGLGFLWVVDQNNPNVQYFREDGSGTWDEGESVSPPSGLAPERPRFAGATADATGSRLFLADRANRGVWVLDDSTGPGGRAWSATSPVAPSSPPLGVPAGVAVDPAGSHLWVADTENQGLRLLLLDPSVTPSPAADYEQEPGVGWWHRRLFRPADGMGAPQGVAVNPWGSTVVTVDSTSLWFLDFTPAASGGFTETWTSLPLQGAAAGLADARPSGVAFDAFRNVVYVNTRTGEIWKCHLGPPATFTRLAGAPGG